MDILDLQVLADGIGNLTAEAGAAFAQAAGVCLEREGHAPGSNFHVKTTTDLQLICSWAPCTDKARATWQDAEEATEFGATGCAVLLAKRVIGFEVVERSRKGTGFDFWIGDASDFPFQNKARLEISGLGRGTEAQIEQRISQKLKQTNRSDGIGIPAYVAVTEFGTPRSIIVQKK